MAFDQSVITGATAVPSGADLLVSWISTAPLGTLYQVYVDRALTWSGTALSCVVPMPDGPVEVAVGAVAAGEGRTDFSASLSAAPWQDHALLSWQGGTFEGADIAGFHVYSSAAPGGAVSYAAPVATVAAYPGGIVTDGWGMGGWGEGGWGEAAGDYSWRSGVLAPGVWSFGVRPYDLAGNEGAAVEADVTITGPPPGPSARADGSRLWISAYDPATRVATLEWLPAL